MNPAGNVLGFPEEGLRGLHFYIDGLEFPVVAAEYSERDMLRLRFLDNMVRDGSMDSEEICQWCIRQKIFYSLLHGIRIRHAIRDPGKTWKYFRMRGRLKAYAVSQSDQTVSSM